MVNGTLDSKDNKEEKTREVAEIRMYHFSWNFLQLGYDMLYVVIVVDMKIFYTFNMCATLRPCLFLVDDTVEGKNILEKKTRERVDIRMYHFSLNFLQLGVICCGNGVWHQSLFYISNICNNFADM